MKSYDYKVKDMEVKDCELAFNQLASRDYHPFMVLGDALNGRGYRIVFRKEINIETTHPIY